MRKWLSFCWLLKNGGRFLELVKILFRWVLFWVFFTPSSSNVLILNDKQLFSNFCCRRGYLMTILIFMSFRIAISTNLVEGLLLSLVLNCVLVHFNVKLISSFCPFFFWIFGLCLRYYWGRFSPKLRVMVPFVIYPSFFNWCIMFIRFNDPWFLLLFFSINKTFVH